MPKLTSSEQLKELRAMLKEIGVNTRLKSFNDTDLERRIKILTSDLEDFRNSISTEIKGLNKRFDEMNQNFFDWKSELFTKIDTSYAAPIKKQTEEISALNSQVEEHRNVINKINIKLGFPALS